MSKSYDINHAEQEMLDFVDNEATSIVQALRTMAEKNETDAKSLEDQGLSAHVVKVLRESAASWKGKADEFDRIFDKMPMRE